MRAIGVLLAVGIVGSAAACYNDNDTYLTELRDNLDVTNAIIGRFTLYPPEYYKKRIEIQSAILKKDPNNLEAYDNISVAYDRIGDGENALKWIHEKRKHLGPNAPALQLYSTEANEGTFLIVRWIRGHKPGDVKDAIESEKHIEKALKINPNAHFGREFAQLYCIRAMIECGKSENWAIPFTRALISLADKDHIDRKKLRYGICGMMVLGAAWNVHVFIQAIKELVPDEGQITMLCDHKITFMFAEDQKKLADIRVKYRFKDETEDVPSMHEMEPQVMSELLRNGKDFQKKRSDFVKLQVFYGKHPDTDSDFWNGFEDVPPVPKDRLVTPVSGRVVNKIYNWTLLSGGICIVIPLLGVSGGVAIYRRRMRQRQ